MYLLNNVEPNPTGTGCFSYQVQDASCERGSHALCDGRGGYPHGANPAEDPQTQEFQKETKALLNITPRNVYYVWEATSLGEVPRNQPMPANIANML